MNVSKLIGLPEDEAVKLAIGAGYTVQTVDSRIPMRLSETYRIDRVTIKVSNDGLVTSAVVG